MEEQKFFSFGGRLNEDDPKIFENTLNDSIQSIQLKTRGGARFLNFIKE